METIYSNNLLGWSGAVAIDDVLILAFQQQMVLLNTDGERIEKIDIASVLQQFANNPIC